MLRNNDIYNFNLNPLNFSAPTYITSNLLLLLIDVKSTLLNYDLLVLILWILKSNNLHNFSLDPRNFSDPTHITSNLVHITSNLVLVASQL